MNALLKKERRGGPKRKSKPPKVDKEQLPPVQVVSTKEMIAELAASKDGTNPKKKQRGEDTIPGDIT